MHFLTSSIWFGLAALCLALYTEKQEQSLNVIIEKCAEEQGIELSNEFTEHWKYTGDLFPDEEKSKKFALCSQRMINMWNADGTSNIQAMIDFLADGHDVQAVTEATQKCNTDEGDTIEDKGYNFYKCFFAERIFDL
ncbi:uncharacterized protein LOC131428449 [Malaya genurostris]|uniref:uncharacterized protein LOC131428449 n=1 Tax=Malaya genurostris TaxID=325434 RepID=UPI0026F3BDCF|nr:uncharacterized protein LOC131428449 [Malaya genurostris]